MRKIMTVVGARPQFIKVAPVSRVLRHSFEELIVNTGQHYDYKMAGVFFEELGIPKPDYDLGIGSSTHGKQTGLMLDKIEELLIAEKPEGVLVYGDTNSTLAGALAASKLHIPLFHVESGLRSFNKKMPEEVNRILTDHVSQLLFAPTETAVRNLSNEGIINGVSNIGDVMYDAVLYNTELTEKQYDLHQHFGVESGSYYLATIHRAENTDDKNRLKAILSSIASIPGKVILPLHPRTKARINEFGLDEFLGATNLMIIDPVSYLEMILLEKNAKGIVTDSGGVQKEAYFMKVPCFTLRSETEWVETVECGWNRLVNPETECLSDYMNQEITQPYSPNLFGNGQASHKIVTGIKEFFGDF
ncbi:MAG TPA: UDP-N-acetylglucosamine 2-epimerase (non-hydrolyzing) [Bacillota bacterium]|nr:UDP-N-acetylglucosamine 2-epimerase (non-hydrolyzing) [Bacillota bacterium]